MLSGYARMLFHMYKIATSQSSVLKVDILCCKSSQPNDMPRTPCDVREMQDQMPCVNYILFFVGLFFCYIFVESLSLRSLLDHPDANAEITEMLPFLTFL